MSGSAIPEKCRVCPVRSQRAPFCWNDLKDQMAHLAQVSRLRELGRGDALYHQGDEAAGWYIVRRGRILEYMVDGAGREQIIRLVAPGGVVGISGLGPWGRHWSSARAGLTGAQVCHVAREQARRMIAEYPALAHCLLAGMAEEVRRAYFRLHGLITLPARPAVAGALLSAAEKTAESRWLVLLTRRELANIVGVTLETVVRILGEFRAQGLVRDLGQSRIEILDTCRLHAAAEGMELELDAANSVEA